MGTIAVASSTIQSGISAVTTYSRSLSRTFAKRPLKETSSSSDDDSPSQSDNTPLAYTASLDGVYTHNPVTQAYANYDSHRVERLAYKMASKTLPNYTDRSKHRKTHNWSPIPRTCTNSRFPSVPQEHGKVHDATVETAHFGQSVVATGLRVPVSFFYNLANGFHNAPSFLLSDDTVRRRDNITGLGSGVKVASKEVVFGLYDGVTGLVTQPYTGAQRDGLVGFSKGVGKGVGGLVFKSGAAGVGIMGYTLKGVEKQFEKRYSRGLKANLLAQRLKQGLRAFGAASEEEKNEVLKRWRDLDISI